MNTSAQSWASSEQARRTMRANRSRDTAPELAVRRKLHHRGWRFRVNYRALPDDRRRTVDIAFTRAKLVVLIDGCFWHGCKSHFIAPKSNQQYWDDKISRNRSRDTETTRRLKAAGWQVLRFWEHQSPEAVVAKIETTLLDATGRTQPPRPTTTTRPDTLH